MGWNKEAFIILFVATVSFFLVSAANSPNHSNVYYQSEGNYSEDIKPASNLDQFVYATSVNLDTGKKTTVKKRLGDIIENENVVPLNMARVQNIEKNIDLIYDKTIEEKLNIGTEKIKVLIGLRELSGIVVEGTKEERDALINQKEEWYESKVSEILSDLDGEIDLIASSVTGIQGYVSREGFEIVINNSYVSSVVDMTNAPSVGVLLDESVDIINVDPQVWNLGYTGSGIDVCVIDTGVNASLPSLSGVVVDEKCYCDDCCPGGGSSGDDAEDDNGHGTHVIGIVASQDSTYKGVAYNANIYAVKVLNSTGHLENSNWNNLRFAIAWCKDQGVDIISMSLGTETVFSSSSCVVSSDVNTEITSSYNNNIFVTAASGNEHSTSGISYPACRPEVVSVGASTNFDTITSYTNRLPGLLDLLAPGGFILGSGYCDGRICSTQMTGGFTGMTGTSQATPHVAGAAALLLDVNSSLSPDEIKNILVDTGTNVDGYPRIDVLAAINSLNESDDNPIEYTFNCTEPGYEECFGFVGGDCDVSFALNHYKNVNDIKWGPVSDSSDPYVIDNYTFGWKGIDVSDMYYNVSDPNTDCDYTGCDTGEIIVDTGTRDTISAPGTAHRDLILGWDINVTHACFLWFDEFDPSYQGSNPIYVLTCFSDNDCSSNQYCNRSGSWSQWSCVNDKNDGQFCTSNSQCLSGYCDNEGFGLSDDFICFTPVNTYFQNESGNNYCELSTGYGILECDERQVDINLDICIGISYYEEECSSSCGYSDVTSVFECTDSGCGCSQPLCDGLTNGSNITTCSANLTYFADRCTSTAGGEDRTDNICRSSAFGSGCTADSQCDGRVAGTNDCSATCVYTKNPPTTPSNLSCDGMLCTNNGTFYDDLLINCSGSTDPEGHNITYSIDAYYNHSGEMITSYFNGFIYRENLTFTDNNVTKYLEIPRYANVTNASLKLKGRSSNYYLDESPEGYTVNSLTNTSNIFAFTKTGQNVSILNKQIDKISFKWGCQNNNCIGDIYYRVRHAGSKSVYKECYYGPANVSSSYQYRECNFIDFNTGDANFLYLIELENAPKNTTNAIQILGEDKNENVGYWGRKAVYYERDPPVWEFPYDSDDRYYVINFTFTDGTTYAFPEDVTLSISNNTIFNDSERTYLNITLDELNDSSTSKNLTFSGGENQTLFFKTNKDNNFLNSYFNVRGYYILGGSNNSNNAGSVGCGTSPVKRIFCTQMKVNETGRQKIDVVGGPFKIKYLSMYTTGQSLLEKQFIDCDGSCTYETSKFYNAGVEYLFCAENDAGDTLGFAYQNNYPSVTIEGVGTCTVGSYDENGPYVVATAFSYPNNVSIYLNNSNIKFINQLDHVNQTNEFSTEINNYLDSCISDASNECEVPINVYSDTKGIFEIKDINLKYNSSRTFFDSETNFSNFSSILNSALNNGVCNCNGCILEGEICKIPFLFHTNTAGTIEYSNLEIIYQLSDSTYGWSNIGNHTPNSTLLWNIDGVDSQSQIALRCRAIDLQGSNFYSDYYSPAMSLTISKLIDISDLTQLNSNGTQRTFGFFIQNLNSSTMNNISWKLNTGQNNITSNLNSTLDANESKYVIVEYNYTSSGNYTVTATATSGGISDFASIQITVLIVLFLMQFGAIKNKKIKSLIKTKKGRIKLGVIFALILFIVMLTSFALSSNNTTANSSEDLITGDSILGQLINDSNQTLNETNTTNNTSEEEIIPVIEEPLNITENSTEINQTIEPEEQPLPKENQTNLTQPEEINVTEPIGVNETNTTEPVAEIAMITSQGESTGPATSSSETYCNGNVCTTTFYSSPIFTKEGGRWRPFGEVSSIQWNSETDSFKFSYRDYEIYLEPFVIYNGQYRNLQDIRNSFPNINIGDYANTQRFGHKFALNLSNIPQNLVNGVDYLGFRLVSSRGLTWDDVERTGDYGIVIKNKVQINFGDLIDNGYTLNFVNQTYLLIGNISANYRNGNIYLDPTIFLQGSSTLDDISCSSAGGCVDYTYVDVDHNSVSPDRGIFDFDTSSLPSSYLASEAYFGVYQFVEAFEAGEWADVSAYYIINDSWNESSITWSNQPCGASFNDSDNCNLTALDSINHSDGVINMWRVFNVTNAVNQDTNHKISLALKTPENDSSSGGADLVRYWSSEYTTDPSLRPYLNITYTNLACESDLHWDFPGFKQRMTTNLTFVASLTDFPYYLNISYEPGMQSDFDDLRFSDVNCGVAGGVEIAYDLENYTSDYAIVHLLVPSPVTGLNPVCVYFDNSTVSSGENEASVWGNGLEGVYHTSESNGLPQDSTSNNRDGTCSGNVCPTYNGSGIIDGALQFNNTAGSNNWINLSGTTGLDLTSELTIEGWFVMASNTNDRGLLTKWNGNGYMLFQHTSNSIRFYISGTNIQSSNLAVGQKYYIVGTWDQSSDGENPTGEMVLYINGVSNATGNDTSIGTNTLPVVFGTYNGRTQSIFNGTMDELRISNVVRSPEWINQTYQMVVNQKTFVSFGNPENPVPKWKFNSTSSTDAGTNIQHKVCLTDDSLAGYIFSFDNGVGSFSNDSFIYQIGQGYYANTTKTVNSTAGTTIRWIYYFNDSLNQLNQTDTFSYVTTGNNPPTHNNPLIIPSNPNDNQNITCLNQSTSDPGDNVTNIYNWIVNGTPMAVLNMPFDTNVSNTSSNKIRDYSGMDNNGTLGTGNSSNAPVWTSSGKIGGAYSFDGVDDYIDITQNLSEDLVGKPITVEVWIKPNADSQGDKGIVSKWPSSQGFMLYIVAGAKPRFYINSAFSEGTTVFTKDNWYHLTGVWNTTHSLIYVNGVLEGTASAPTITTNPRSTLIGTYGDPPRLQSIFNGTIDNVHIYGKTFSSAKIYQNYLDTKNGYSNSSMITSDETNNGETWTCQVTPNDAKVDGITKETSVNISVIANETQGRNAILEGINNIIPNATIYTDFEIDIRYFNGNQSRGIFDKVAFLNNKTWAFNYVTGNETFTNVSSSSYKVFNVWENQSLTYSQIVSQVQNYINGTLN